MGRGRVIAATFTACAVALFYGPAVRGQPTASPLGPIDRVEEDCFEAVPEVVGAEGVTDAGQDVVLDVIVLYDDITKSRAVQVMERAAQSYSPLSIELVVRRYKRIWIAGDPPRPGGTRPSALNTDLFRAIRSTMGGSRPDGIDVVHLLTGKDVYYVNGGQPAYSLGGEAACIGGVRYPAQAIAFSEGEGEWDEVREDMAGVIAAHEIGHVMGAHHHYGNCGQGSPLMQDNDETPCTVMFPFFISMNAGNFGTLEGAVVRGHAVEFASP